MGWHGMATASPGLIATFPDAAAGMVARAQRSRYGPEMVVREWWSPASAACLCEARTAWLTLGMTVEGQ